MIEFHLNKNNLCDAFLEWTLVDKDGKVSNNGEYIYLREMWTFEKNGLHKILGKRVFDKTPKAKYIYWKRKKYGGRMKCIPKWRFFKKWLSKKEDKNEVVMEP